MYPPDQQPEQQQPAAPTQPARVPSTKDAKFWKEQIEQAKSRRRRYEPWWEACLKAYAPQMAGGDPQTYGSDIHTNRTFTLVERKKADLFYQKPDVTLQPTPLSDGPIVTDQVDPMTGQPQPLMGPPDPQSGQQQPVLASAALSAHEEIVNEKLGDDGIDATEMMDSVIFDIVCHQAVGFTKMGYESYTVPTQTADPLTGEPRTVQVPIAEKCFWEHFSGKQAVIPANFRSTNWDRAPFLGMQFELPLTPGNRTKYNLPPDFKGTKPDAQQHYDHGEGSQGTDEVFTGVELEYRSCLFREDVHHPDHLTQLVMVDGIDEPVIERDSPYQTLLPTGDLSPDSLIGFSIHPFSTRKLTDSAYVPSDGTMIRPLENELDVFRTQMVQFRDAQTLRYIANGDVITTKDLDKIVRSPIGGITVVPGEAFVGEGAIKALEGGSMPRESFTSNDYIDNDMARTTAIDASGSGVQGIGSQTATAEQIQSANANARMDKERAIILKRYIRGVTKFSTLLQRYLPVKHAAEIVGPQRAQVWDAWRKTANSSLAFTALPDSALRVDQAVDRKAAMDLYSFLANDPFIQKGRMKLLEKLLRKHHVDPTGIVQAPDPGKPEPPKLALSFSGEDLVGPQAPIVIEILQQQGIQISPAAVQQSQGMLLQAEQLAAAQAQQAGNTKHGGKLAQQESLSKHAADQTGGMQGTGAPAAMGAPGGQLQ
jgi:hypothetical protein